MIYIAIFNHVDESYINKPDAKEDMLYDFNSFLFVKACFMVQCMIYLGDYTIALEIKCILEFLAAVFYKHQLIQDS